MEVKPYVKEITIEVPEGCAGRKHPFNIPAIRNIETLRFHSDVTFIIGENGSGKSTLLEAIALLMDLGAQGGTGNFKLADPYGISGLHNHMKIKRSFERPKDRYFLRAESFYNIGTYLEELAASPDARLVQADPTQEEFRNRVFRRYGGVSPHHRSHGESFISLITHAFGGKGLYILDEPEAALSPQRQLAALVRIHDLVLDQSQFIIATHSPILMSYPGARMYMLDENGCSETTFEETDHYRVTRDFLLNHPKRLKHLLSKQPLLDLLEQDE